MLEIIIFEFVLIWSYFFVVIQKIFSFSKNILFSIFVSNISLLTFIGTIILGLFKFDIIFVVFSVSLVMIGMHLLYDSIKRRYDILSKKNHHLSKIKPVLDYSVMALILYKIIN
ncbi:hypothetical protein N9V07_02355 [Candidatus Pelagibacter sp.]|nr:hypothetical protein [Candidatus Pelagibacter sp.]|tara:strand:- start:1630 stop:1971 length:342 start_codon:yes stop_codon:yes gene_type:complete